MGTCLLNYDIAGLVAPPEEVLYANNALSITGAGNAGVTQEILNYTLPGGIMGANDTLVIETMWHFTGAAGTKTRRILFGGNQIAVSAGLTSGADSYAMTMVNVCNINDVAVQQGISTLRDEEYFVQTSSAINSMTVDTSADVAIVFEGVLDNAADDMNLSTVRILLRRSTV